MTDRSDPVPLWGIVLGVGAGLIVAVILALLLIWTVVKITDRWG